MRAGRPVVFRRRRTPWNFLHAHAGRLRVHDHQAGLGYGVPFAAVGLGIHADNGVLRNFHVLVDNRISQAGVSAYLCPGK